MNYEQRMKIIAAAIAAETAVTIDKNLEKGILDGFYRIDLIEKQEQKALDPLMPFHVERIQEGYGIWNSGGYDEQRRLGRSTVAAGPDGERLRQVRYKKEVNGDHSLAVIYPGCYIAQSVAFDYYESNDTTVYRVERIGMRDGWYLADCRKVLRINPQMSKLTEEEEKRLERLLKISNQVAIAPNLARLKEGWV